MSEWIFFDLDGTLVDSGDGIIRSVRYALEKLGLPDAPDSVLRRFIGPPLHESFMEFCGLSRERAQEAVEMYRERYRPIGVHENTLFPGMRKMLQALKASGKRLGVATSKPVGFAETILRQHHVRSLFSEVVGANLDGSMTDKADVLREAIRRCGTKDICMVGDRHYDVEGAKACGLPCVGVQFGFAEPGELEAAGAVSTANTVAELGTILLNF